MQLPENLTYMKHYLIGDSLIDTQHIDMVKRITSAGHTIARVELLRGARDLYNMWRQHIQCEEALMEKIHYPYILYHKQRHVVITELCLSAIESISDTPSEVFTRYNQLIGLKQSLMSHIDNEDRNICHYIQTYKDTENESGYSTT